MSIDFSKIDLNNFDFDTLPADEYREFLQAWSDYHGRLNRVSVDVLEQEFERKSDYLQCGEHYELSELYPDEFVELLFERKAFEHGEGIIPFEEVQSYEYQLWLKQKIRNKALRSESSNSDDAQSEKIDYSGYRMWRYNPVVFYKDGKKNRHRLLLKDDGESLSFLNGRDFAILSPVTYVGRTKYYEQVGKETKEITEEILFDLPDKWQWCRIGTIFMHNNGKQLNKGNTKGKLMKYVTTSNLYWDGFVLDNLKEMPFEENEIERCMAVKGDLLVCEGGDIGRSCIWNYDFPIMLQNHIHKLRPYIPVCTKFFYYIFNLYNLTGLIGGKGIGIQGFSSKALHNTLIPLPPLKEQYRIVAQIEKLFEHLR